MFILCFSGFLCLFTTLLHYNILKLAILEKNDHDFLSSHFWVLFKVRTEEEVYCIY